MSFAPRDTHEAQVQFALERGVPALLGVFASKRLPYPSRAFDMAHCSRCLIPWGQLGIILILTSRYPRQIFHGLMDQSRFFWSLKDLLHEMKCSWMPSFLGVQTAFDFSADGLYLMEVDRVLRPGGYWILSGPPINWKSHWKGWERTQDDLKSEQDKIESVARRLCWKKVIQKGDIAIWQKPTNHVHCKASRKVIKFPPFCPAQQPDVAWYNKLLRPRFFVIPFILWLVYPTDPNFLILLLLKGTH